MRGCFSQKRSQELLHVSGFLDPLLHGRNLGEMHSTELSLPATCAYGVLELWLVWMKVHLGFRSSTKHEKYLRDTFHIDDLLNDMILGYIKMRYCLISLASFYLCWERLPEHLELPPWLSDDSLGQRCSRGQSWILNRCAGNVFSCLSCPPQGLRAGGSQKWEQGSWSNFFCLFLCF